MNRTFKTLIFVTLLALIVTAAASCGGDKAVHTTEAASTTALTQIDPPSTTVAPTTTSADSVSIDKSSSEISTYNNPIKGDNTSSDLWGDPFCMRYDGKYYIYCSNHTDYVFCYESTDLVNWTDKGKCVIFDSSWPTKDPYAPEVTYFNGKFYMVTSLSGDGHYVLVADKPEGPFKKASENQGLSIDGHIFIDNNGKWYFYRASGSGIMCHEMTSPTEFVQAGTKTGAIINDGGGTWTEGPMVVYHDGIYYLTYTGNHVLSNSYRIDYAVNENNPLIFSMAKENPVLVAGLAREGNKSTGMHGVGHSSSVKGPDLDSYYIVYHAMSNKLGIRTMNIDRIVFNGEKMAVLGPTEKNAQVCAMPDIYAQLDSASDADIFDGVFTISGGELSLGAGEMAVSKKGLGRDYYTIEITTSEIGKSGKAGAVFGYKDDKNYGTALFDTSTEELVITFIVNGEKTEHREKLVRSFDMAYDFSAVQAIQIEKNGNEFTFYVNDRELCKKESSLDGDKVGVIANGAGASFGYIGATANIGGSSTKDHYKPAASLTGRILGIHCTERDVQTGNERTGEKFVIAPCGESLNYRILAEQNGFYDIAVNAECKEGAVISVYADGVYKFDLTFEADSGYQTQVGRGIELTGDRHVITLYVKEGSANIMYLETPYSEQVVQISDDFSSKSHKRLIYTEGTGLTVSGGVLKGTLLSRRLYGDQNFGDYTFEFDVVSTGSSVKFGAIVRAQTPCVSTLLEGGINTPPVDSDVASCINWMRGYYLEFGNGRVTLYKCNFGSVKKSEGEYDGFKMKTGETYRVRIDCEGANIRVYVNGALAMNYTDSEPYIQGLAGFRSTNTQVTYDNMTMGAVKKADK